MGGPEFAVANSVACHVLATALEEAGVPVVALVHEFARAAEPLVDLNPFFAGMSAVVYSDALIAEAMAEQFVAACGRGQVVAAQGHAELPGWVDVGRAPLVVRTGFDGLLLELPEIALEDLLGTLDPAAVLIVGVGALCAGQGVEFFLEAAGRVRPTQIGRPVHFAWVGERLDQDADYLAGLFDQWKRLPAGSSVHFVAPPGDLSPLYRRADVMFLSARLDPFPQAAIDAAHHQLPVVCFDRASGFAGWLLGIPEAKQCVVPYLDSAAAAQVLVELACDEAERRRLGQALQQAAESTFRMDRYADFVADLGRQAAAVRAGRAADRRTILVPGGFMASFYTGGEEVADPAVVADRYLQRVQAAAPLSRSRSGLLVQRPTPGFHPLAYAESAPDFTDDGTDPFAHYLRCGRPKGRWTKRIITAPAGPGPRRGRSLKVLVHGHFHYPDLLPDFLDLLAVNSTPVTLALTTTTTTAAADLRRIVRERGLADHSTVAVVPNRGRNLSALFSGPVAELMGDHDLVLHVHGKRSPHLPPEMGRQWRLHLWEHLVGGRSPLADHLVAEFARSPKLGLVAPEDRRLNDWDINADHLPDLLARLGRQLTTPVHFDFPLGAMFWARTAALRPFLAAKFTEVDYPAEPLAPDGTGLHTLERLIPLIIEDDGYEFAKTFLPDLRSR